MYQHAIHNERPQNKEDFLGDDHLELANASTLRTYLRRLGGKRRSLVTSLATVFAFTTLTIALIACRAFLWPLLRRYNFHDGQSWWDLGFKGAAPARSYHSFPQLVPDIEFLQLDSRCSHDDIFMAPVGQPAGGDGALLMDWTGEVIWRQTGVAKAEELRMQEYKGEKVLTYWGGKPDANGRKAGTWFMMDQTYTIQREITAAGNHDDVDLHEFEITPEGTVLMTVYDTTEGDLSSVGGPSKGYLLDCFVQEVDIETGELVFEWQASKHIPLEATIMTREGCRQRATAFEGCGDRPDSPFDWYHMNSVEKDDKGNYLVSGRHVGIMYIGGRSGDVIWMLGGRLNEFEDLSDGLATDFIWQHHARFHDNGTALSLFDNHASNPWLDVSVVSRGLILDLNVYDETQVQGEKKEYKGTVSLRQAYYNSEWIQAVSRGNIDMLDDTGNVFVGWGISGAFTEYTASGDILCDAHLTPSAFFSFGTVATYRIHRGEGWVGFPTTKPSAVVEGRDLFVSWNGATEVVSWRVEGVVGEDGEAGEMQRDEEFEAVRVVAKSGFETKISMPDLEAYEKLRVLALDKKGDVLGVSNVLEVSCGFTLTPLDIVSLAAITVLILAIVAMVFIACRLWGFFSRRRQDKGRSQEYMALSSEVEGAFEDADEDDAPERRRSRSSEFA